MNYVLGLFISQFAMYTIVLVLLAWANGGLICFLYSTKNPLSKSHAKLLMWLSIIFSSSYIIEEINAIYVWVLYNNDWGLSKRIYRY